MGTEYDNKYVLFLFAICHNMSEIMQNTSYFLDNKPSLELYIQNIPWSSKCKLIIFGSSVSAFEYCKEIVIKQH